MLAPNIAYAFSTPKDVAGPTFEVVTRTIAETDSVIAITIDTLEVPKDRLLVVANICMIANPNAGNGVVNMVASVITAAGQRVQLMNLELPATADAEETLNWQGEVFVLGGGQDTSSLRFYFEFDNALAANQATASYTGIIVPRGNAGPW